MINIFKSKDVKDSKEQRAKHKQNRKKALENIQECAEDLCKTVQFKKGITHG